MLYGGLVGVLDGGDLSVLGGGLVRSLDGALNDDVVCGLIDSKVG